jgi:hypothetical protein
MLLFQLLFAVIYFRIVTHEPAGSNPVVPASIYFVAKNLPRYNPPFRRWSERMRGHHEVPGKSPIRGPGCRERITKREN